MKSMNLALLGRAAFLTFLICAGFWLYTKWDLKRFKDSLSKALPVQTANSETASIGHAVLPQEDTESTQTVYPAAPEPAAPLAVKPVFDDTDVAEVPADDADFEFESVLETFSEEIEADAVAFGDFTDVSEEAPYDQAFVKKGFDDYNAYLEIAPEYAYQRLADAFREQYGDDPDVDILVENVRRSNNGTATIDTEIENAEVMMRLVSKISPPEALESIESYLGFLMETKQLALEQGTEVLFESQNIIGE